MALIVGVVGGMLAIFFAGFYALRFVTAERDKRRRLMAAALFMTATLSPIVVTLLSPRTGGASGFTEFSDAPQSPTVSAIIKGVGYFFLVAVVLLAIIRTRVVLPYPAAAVALVAYAVVGWVSSLINFQRASIDLFYPALAVTGVLAASAMTFATALRLSRATLRIYVYLSLVLAVVAPQIAFWDGQGRTWYGFSQLAGVTTHPNGMGTVAALAVIVELVRMEGLKRPRIWHLVAAVVALLGTQSRGAWLSAAIGLLLYLTFRSGARWVMILLPVVMISLLAASTLLENVFDALTHWSAGGDISTLNGRTTIWANALGAVSRNPVFGTGPRSFDLEYRSSVLGLGNLISSSNAHNQFVQTLVERGVVGLMILTVFLVALTGYALRVGHHPTRAGLVAVVAVFVSRFAVETPLNISTASLNGALLVVVTVLLASSKSEHRLQPIAENPRGVRPPDAYWKSKLLRAPSRTSEDRTVALNGRP
ncbi:O-antigen ligase family protein [Pseudarthrobacter enclensis]|uniref:O-antigen ligase n=1 Tax=Pseudarthrobacter enclensis TaxID=993070 RepID=A0ABT9RQ90_9MICC|nr:O-antigen ligase family protein [Pseudarthrobacter enclensis]MDP9887391.1 O-antigen ligase [Pseudarthrobacter enclensis]